LRGRCGAFCSLMTWMRTISEDYELKCVPYEQTSWKAPGLDPNFCPYHNLGSGHRFLGSQTSLIRLGSLSTGPAGIQFQFRTRTPQGFIRTSISSLQEFVNIQAASPLDSTTQQQCPTMDTSNSCGRSTMTEDPVSTAVPAGRWWDKYPKPRSSPKSLDVDELHSLLRGTASNRIIVIDVRRTDIEVGIIYRCGHEGGLSAGTSAIHDPKRHQPAGSDILSDFAHFGPSAPRVRSGSALCTTRQIAHLKLRTRCLSLLKLAR